MKAGRLKGWTDRRISLPRDVAPTKRLKPKNDAVLNLKCDVPCLYYFFLAVVVIRYETTATARWALLFIVRTFFNDTITVAVWTGFHVGLMGMLPHPRDYIRWCFADPAVADAFAKEFATSLMDSALH